MVNVRIQWRHFFVSCAFMLLICFVFSPSAHGKRSSLNDNCFRIYMDGGPVGYDCVEFTRASSREGLNVRRSILIQVEYAGITVYQYRHEDREQWVNGGLWKLESWTTDNGTEFHVRARQFEKGLLVDNGDTHFWVDRNVIPTSYWNKQLVNSDELLDTQSGILREVDVERNGRRTVTTRHGSRDVTLYQVSGDVELTVGYDMDNRWRWLQFRRSGSTFEYKPADVSPEDWRRDPFYDRNLNVKNLKRSSIR